MQILIQNFIKVGGWLKFQVGSFMYNYIKNIIIAAEFKVGVTVVA